jgi:hypothetical protein
MKTTIILTMALSSIAQADLPVFVRDPNKPTSIQHGLVNGHAVLLDVYGKNSIQAAHKYGKALVGHHSFAESKQLIQSKAEQLYPGQPAMIRWFEQDCANSYDQEARVSR